MNNPDVLQRRSKAKAAKPQRNVMLVVMSCIQAVLVAIVYRTSPENHSIIIIPFISLMAIVVLCLVGTYLVDKMDERASNEGEMRKLTAVFAHGPDTVYSESLKAVKCAESTIRATNVIYPHATNQMAEQKYLNGMAQFLKNKKAKKAPIKYRFVSNSETVIDDRSKLFRKHGVAAYFEARHKVNLMSLNMLLVDNKVACLGFAENPNDTRLRNAVIIQGNSAFISSLCSFFDNYVWGAQQEEIIDTNDVEPARSVDSKDWGEEC